MLIERINDLKTSFVELENYQRTVPQRAYLLKYGVSDSVRNISVVDLLILPIFGYLGSNFGCLLSISVTNYSSLVFITPKSRLELLSFVYA